MMVRVPVLPGDISAVARALLSVPPAARDALCGKIFDGAQKARVFVNTHRVLHPAWGDGTLNSAARRFALADEPGFEDPDYVSATQMVLAHLSLRLQAAVDTRTDTKTASDVLPPADEAAKLLPLPLGQAWRVQGPKRNPSLRRWCGSGRR